jgi:Raf kinase inhibitor-like YbhB/YbcL family protein
MKTTLKIFVAAGCALGALNAQQQAQPKAPPRPGLTLSSTAFEDGGVIPNKYTQAESTWISPKLEWINAPANVVTYALIMHDPDVAMQRKTDDVTHWVIFNIPGTATGLPEAVPNTATLPDGTVQLKNVRGSIGYLGPGAPAPGPHHHYTFELYALDTKLDLGPDATRAEVLKAMDGHIIGKGVVEGRFHK